MKSDAEVASDDAEAIERAEREFAADSQRLLRQYTAKIELAETVETLKKVGDAITPQLKSKMLPPDLASLREKYLRRQSDLGGERSHEASETYNQALADPTGGKAAELLASQLGERGKRLMGLI